MARPKKDGRRAKGIQGKKGYLYALIPRTKMVDGKAKYTTEWLPTHLQDKPENIDKALAFRDKIINNEGPVTIDRNITLSDYVDHFLEEKKRNIADTTYAAYFYRAKRIKEFFQDMKIKKIGRKNIEDFFDSCFIDYGDQPRTVKDMRTFLNGVMEQACKDGIIAYNPVKDVAISKKLAAKYAKPKSSGDDFLAYEEAQLFLEKAKDERLYEVYYLALFFGLRREEVLGLKWSAINFKEKRMVINHTVTKGTVINHTNTTKTRASERTYPLTDEQIDMFKRLKKQEKEYRRLCRRSYKDNDYIFKFEDGTLYYPDYITKSFRKFIKRNPELPQNLTFHGLRRSCVSILVHQGMDVKSIQNWVGHADINTTLAIYAKVKDQDAKKEISDKLKNTIPLNKYSGS